MLEINGPVKNAKKAEILYWTIFSIYIAFLLKTAFEKGLPLRGAIDYGQFFLRGKNFAGKPIVNCYRLSHELQFSGCAFTETSSKLFDGIRKSSGEFKNLADGIVVKYLAPLKNDEEKKLSVINWIWAFDDDKKIKKDVRQFVTTAFRAHNKDLSLKVLPKFENTEMM